MRITRILALGALTSLTILAACTDSGSDPSVFGTGGASGKGTGGKTGTAGTSSAGGDNQGEGGSDPGAGGSAGSGVVIPGGGQGGGTSVGPCPNVPGDDHDGDGWTEEQGDCNDCDPNVNPGAIDIVNYSKNTDGSQGDPLPPDQQIDEDCDGKTAQPNDPTSCDAGLGADVKDAFDAARAIGLCQVKVDKNSRKWGVIQAGFNRISGTFLGAPLQVGKNVGILPHFGTATTPLEGERVFALSTGEARAGIPNTCGQIGFQGDSFPPGFPKEGSCGETGAPFDGVALDLQIRVPTNAKSMKFNFRFFTCEFPQYVCEQYNDVFAVLMVPNPLPTDHQMYDPASQSADIAFEGNPNNPKAGNVIGVNNQSFLTACKPGVSGYNKCVNETPLAGSGFEGHAGSAWLSTQVPVPPGQIISLRFAIWDSGDGALDSSTVVDNFQWSAEAGTGVVTQIDPEIN